MSHCIFNMHGNKIDFEIHCSLFCSQYDPSFHVIIKYSIDIYMSIDYGIIQVHLLLFDGEIQDKVCKVCKVECQIFFH